MEYEYKITTIDVTQSIWRQRDIDETVILKEIDNSAIEGWEFVSAVPLARLSLFRHPGTTSKILLFFKRPKK